MRKRVVAASAAFILGSLSAAVHAAVSVEQIEAYESNSDNSISTRYAPVIFGGNSTITLGVGDLGGFFGGITFHAVGASNLTSSDSSHAYSVGRNMYGTESVAYGQVSDVYSDAYDDFLNNVVKTQNSTGTAVAPGNFSAGVKVVNTSYVVTYGSTSPNTPTTDTDALRRIDTMVKNDNVTLVAGAVTNTGDGNFYTLNWSCFNSLAVTGVQSFNPAGGPGKQHADLYLDEDASFGAGAVSSYSAALYADATSAGQTDANQNVVNRSLLMAGADKTTYTRQTANNLDTTHGAGEPNFFVSNSILQSGEMPILNVSGGSVTGTPSSLQEGWSYGTINAGGQSVILFQVPSTNTGLTASLNWNVNSTITGGNINTSSVVFPNLGLEVRPVTFNAGTGKYVLATTNQSNPMLHSAATGDNVQYLYDTSSLSAGTYAFLITGDPALSPSIGFSYAFSGTFATQWNSSAGGSWGTQSNWTSGMADGRGAVANFLSSPGLTVPGNITLDGSRVVGAINFNNPNGYSITSGSGGTLDLDDTGDVSGTVNPSINVSSGSHFINVPVSMVHGMNVNTASGTSLTFGGGIGGSYYIIKYGPGTMIFNSVINDDSIGLVGGTTIVTPSGVLASGPTYINTGTTLNFAAAAGGGFLVRNIGVLLTDQAGGLLSLSPAAVTANRQLLITTGGLLLAGTTGAWTGAIDLANNDMDEPGASLASLTNQLAQGFNNGKWNGSGGIVSSSAAANTAHLSALGIIQNNQGGSPLFTASNPFDSTTPGASDILIKYTYYGDTNLDGKVDGTDYSRIDNGFLMHLTGWYNGDFNYDGVVNGSDYTLIDNAFNQQGAVLADAISTAQIASQVAPVPEPAAISMIVTGTAILLGRRRPKKPPRQSL